MTRYLIFSCRALCASRRAIKVASHNLIFLSSFSSTIPTCFTDNNLHLCNIICYYYSNYDNSINNLCGHCKIILMVFPRFFWGVVPADSYQYQLQSMWQKCWNTNQSLVHNLRFRERGPLKSWRPETMAEAIFSVLKEGLSLSQAAR